jgi:hypothetical protein
MKNLPRWNAHIDPRVSMHLDSILTL